MKKAKKMYGDEKNKNGNLENKKSILTAFFASILKFNLAVALKNFFLGAQKFSISLALLFFFAIIVNAGDVIVESGKLDVDGKLVVDDFGNVGIGILVPTEKLDVAGNVRASGTVCDSNGCIASGGSSFWTQSGTDPDDIYYDTGDVGIGTTGPGAKLDVESADAKTIIRTSNIAADGDPLISWFMPGVIEWTAGMDDSDGDKFKIANSGGLDTLTRLTIDGAGNVGIGVTNPVRKLTVVGDDLTTGIGVAQTPVMRIVNNRFNQNRFAGIQFANGGTADNKVMGVIGTLLDSESQQGGGSLVFGVKSSDAASDVTEYMKIKTGGRVEITGSSSSGNEDLFFIRNSNNAKVFTVTGLGHIGFESLQGSAGSSSLCYREESGGPLNQMFVLTSCSSSSRYKENINPLIVDKNKVLQLQPVSFKWKGNKEDGVGLIAEEVEELIPELVTHKDNKVEGVRYKELTVYLLEIIKEHEEQIKEQQNQIEELKQKTASLERI